MLRRLLWRPQKKFQSTLPRGERQTVISEKNTTSYFNPRSREGSDRSGSSSICRPVLFQSTLPRGERLHPKGGKKMTVGISIHAPARGATVFPWAEFCNVRISIHAPARGATQSSLQCQPQLTQFQSTLPRGERLSCLKS